MMKHANSGLDRQNFCIIVDKHCSYLNAPFFMLNVGVLLAVLERAEIIDPIIDNGQPTSAGTVSAGYQNFLICIEMFFAAIALRYAFPYQVYAQGCITDSHGRSVTMQSISSSLKVCTCFDFSIMLVLMLYGPPLWSSGQSS
jgi:hypothetical protein